jgi:hypothetical protein
MPEIYLALKARQVRCRNRRFQGRKIIHTICRRGKKKSRMLGQRKRLVNYFESAAGSDDSPPTWGVVPESWASASAYVYSQDQLRLTPKC